MFQTTNQFSYILNHPALGVPQQLGNSPRLSAITSSSCSQFGAAMSVDGGNPEPVDNLIGLLSLFIDFNLLVLSRE